MFPSRRARAPASVMWRGVAEVGLADLEMNDPPAARFELASTGEDFGQAVSMHRAPLEPACEHLGHPDISMRISRRDCDYRGGRDSGSRRCARVGGHGGRDHACPRFGALDLRVETKPDLTPVSEARIGAPEKAIRALVARERPGEGVFGEELGDGGGEVRWIVDPIDGTKNYVRGVPVWATLLALDA